ncbi:MAG: hypothetical protein RR419_07075, partial [Akkermansia sp.]
RVVLTDKKKGQKLLLSLFLGRDTNKFPVPFFSIYPAVIPPLGLRWEADANTPLCAVNATRSPTDPSSPPGQETNTSKK